jgi:hypothetical protein
MSIKDIDAGPCGITRKGDGMRWIWFVTVVLGICVPLSAETRMWTDADGVRFEGTYDKEMLGGVLIKDLTGDSHLIRIEQLAGADRDYIEHHVPPTVDAKVDFETRVLPRTEWSREDDDTTIYTFHVTVEKKSRLTYKGRLSAELFIVASERSIKSDKHLVLMDRSKTDFVLPEEKKGVSEFSVPPVAVNSYLAGWIIPFSVANRGKAYLGHVLAVSDSSGQMIFCDTDIAGVKWLTDDLPSSVEKLRELYALHHGSAESRHFNDSFRQVDPPSIPWFQRNPTE